MISSSKSQACGSDWVLEFENHMVFEDSMVFTILSFMGKVVIRAKSENRGVILSLVRQRGKRSGFESGSPRTTWRLQLLFVK